MRKKIYFSTFGKLCLNFIRIRIGIRPRCGSVPDPDPRSSKMMDPDPHIPVVNADPKHCPYLISTVPLHLFRKLLKQTEPVPLVHSGYFISRILEKFLYLQTIVKEWKGFGKVFAVSRKKSQWLRSVKISSWKLTRGAFTLLRLLPRPQDLTK
jgi:hypothetical protein